MNKNLIIGSDHGGYDLKAYVSDMLKKDGYQITDVGTYGTESCHYPEFAEKVALGVASGEFEKGIIICTSGEGVAITANKIKGIRCGIGYNEEVAHLMVEHNNANMIALGAKYLSNQEANNIIHNFLGAKHLGDRHAIRVKMIEDIENKNFK